MIGGFLGGANTGGAGVLTVTGWNLSGTPFNVIVDPATLFKVLVAGNDANGAAIIGLSLLQAAAATTLVINSTQDVLIGDGASSQIALDGLGDIALTAAQIISQANAIANGADLFEVLDWLGNGW